MHEMGVVFYIADAVEKIARENDSDHVVSVTLEIGQVSTVVPSYLEDVWKWNCRRTEILRDCELLVERIHAVTHCDECGQNYDTVPQGRICPHCGSERTWLITGNEVNIKEIAVE